MSVCRPLKILYYSDDRECNSTKTCHKKNCSVFLSHCSALAVCFKRIRNYVISDKKTYRGKKKKRVRTCTRPVYRVARVPNDYIILYENKRRLRNICERIALFGDRQHKKKKYLLRLRVKNYETFAFFRPVVSVHRYVFDVTKFVETWTRHRSASSQTRRSASLVVKSVCGIIMCALYTTCVANVLTPTVLW